MRVQPGSKRDEILGLRDGALWVRVSAPPVEGKANRKLIEIIADRLSVPKGKVKLVKGETSRLKEIEIEGLSEDEVLGAFGSGDKIS